MIQSLSSCYSSSGVQDQHLGQEFTSGLRYSVEMVTIESDIEFLIVVIDLIVLGAGKECPATEEDMEDGSK